MKFLLMMPLIALSIAATNGPCACSLGRLCSWEGTDYSGSHEEYLPGQDVGSAAASRSLLNKTPMAVVVSGQVKGKAASFCLDAGLGIEDTGELVIAKVEGSSTPCA